MIENVIENVIENRIMFVKMPVKRTIIGGITMAKDLLGTGLSLGFKGLGALAKWALTPSKSELRAKLESCYKQDAFGAIISDWREAKQYNTAMTKIDPCEAIIVRHLQILRDSLDIAATSEKLDTATSRLDLAHKTMRDIENGRIGATIDANRVSAIKAEFLERSRRCATAIPVNAARRKLNDADKLTSPKAAIKRVDEAIAILREFLDSPESRKTELNQWIEKAEAKRQELGQPQPTKQKTARVKKPAPAKTSSLSDKYQIFGWANGELE